MQWEVPPPYIRALCPSTRGHGPLLGLISDNSEQQTMARFRRQRSATSSKGRGAMSRMGRYGLKTAMRYAARRLATATKTRTRTASDSRPLTTQFDYKTDYVRRRPNKYKARRARRFQRRVVSVVRKSNAAAQKVIRQSAWTLPTALDQSDSFSYTLYGSDGSTNENINPCADLRELFRECSKPAWDSALNSAISEFSTTKLHFMHAHMEITLKNTGPSDALVEAYHFYCRRDLSNQCPNPTEAYSRGFSKEPIVYDPDSGNSFDRRIYFNDVGSTPFHSTLFTRSFCITKRTKYRMPPGAEISLLIRDNRSRVFTPPSLVGKSCTRATSGVLFQVQGCPGVNELGQTLKAQQAQITSLCIRHYNFRIWSDRTGGTSMETTDPT